ncbi:MAG: FAD-binding oxidoreductase [Saprospiraceae bacterium]|nr:FAD-binding oxidoreductase [Saprospiraceae bacterium]
MPLNTYHLSYWEKDVFFPFFDAVVIGGGITGMSTSIRLAELRPDWKIAVVERGPLPIGASTRNAGFACFGSPTELLDDLDQQPESKVFALVERRWKGLEKLRQRLGDQVIRYNACGGYELFLSKDEEDHQQCIGMLPYLNRQLADITGLSQTFIPADGKLSAMGLKGARHLIENPLEASIHPARMMRAWMELADKMDIHRINGLEITNIEQESSQLQLITSYGWSITAGRVVVATNGFARQLMGDLPLQPARNQVLITHQVKGLSQRLSGCYHYDRGYYYFREVDGRLLLGGARNEDSQGEQTDDFGFNPLIRKALLDMLHTVILPGEEVAIDHWWSGILGVGKQKDPLLFWHGDRILVAVRLGGMGVAIGTLLGEEAADMLLERS